LIQNFVLHSERRTCFETDAYGPSRSSKVVNFGTNRKRVCDFLLVINSNLGPILPRFRAIAGFLRRATPPLFHPNFRGVLLGLGCRCCGLWLRGAKSLVQPIMLTVHCYGQTDRRTDGRLTIAIPRYHYLHRAVKTQTAAHH